MPKPVDRPILEQVTFVIDGVSRTFPVNKYIGPNDCYIASLKYMAEAAFYGSTRKVIVNHAVVPKGELFDD